MFKEQAERMVADFLLNKSSFGKYTSEGLHPILTKAETLSVVTEAMMYAYEEGRRHAEASRLHYGSCTCECYI